MANRLRHVREGLNIFLFPFSLPCNLSIAQTYEEHSLAFQREATMQRTSQAVAKQAARATTGPPTQPLQCDLYKRFNKNPDDIAPHPQTHKTVASTDQTVSTSQQMREPKYEGTQNQNTQRLREINTCAVDTAAHRTSSLRT